MEKIINIRKVGVEHINNYLNSKNLNVNLKNSLINKKIQRLDHYIWWFSNSRKSYIVTFDNKCILFFFHDTLKINKLRKVIFPGWYLSDRKVDFRKVLYALKFQKKMIDKENLHKLKIISVIKNSNIAMIKFAKYLSWKNLDKVDERIFKDIINYFNLKSKLKKYSLFYR